ncbi:MAG: hypothetical protein M0Z46_05935 [Actinomycetota bacterium]|nr:hypothetical protein [Actinomycetota bacterium]
MELPSEDSEQPLVRSGRVQVPERTGERSVVVVEIERRPACAESLTKCDAERRHIGANDMNRNRSAAIDGTCRLVHQARRGQPGWQGKRRGERQSVAPGGVGGESQGTAPGSLCVDGNDGNARVGRHKPASDWYYHRLDI